MKDVSVAVDMETGEVSYTISSDDYVSTESYKNKLEEIDFVTELKEDIRASVPGVDILSNEVENEIKVVATYVIDGDEANNKENMNAANKAVEEYANNQGYSSDINIEVKTHQPSSSPITTTMIPTATPSMTGLIVTFEFRKNEDPCDHSEVQELVSLIATRFGVTASDVESNVWYRARLQMLSEAPTSEASKLLVNDQVQAAVSQALGVAIKYVKVDTANNGDSRSSMISVWSQEFSLATSLKDTLGEGLTQRHIASLVEGSIAGSAVTGWTVVDSMFMTAKFSVDCSSAAQSPVQAISDAIVGELKSESSKCKFDEHTDPVIDVVTSSPTDVPSSAPVSSIPTAAPSMTG